VSSAERWTEWNGRFRDDVRRSWVGDAGMIGSFASRICGSSDLYQSSGKGPASSLNFITCHDGFTLNDLVSYKQKHNDENGEFSRDGTDANYSDNCGMEGPSHDPGVEGMRNRLIKNFLLTLFISRGVPMLLGGDEFRRTRRGNNNAYCSTSASSKMRCLYSAVWVRRFGLATTSGSGREPETRSAPALAVAALRCGSLRSPSLRSATAEPTLLSPGAIFNPLAHHS
jgi:hypothetical protein